MRNNVFEYAVERFGALLGSSPQDLASGTGSRFTNSRRGKVTVYHANIASGNRAEVAFHVESLSERLHLQSFEANQYFQRAVNVTGRPVERHPRYQWPRVGLSSREDVDAIIEFLEANYTSP